MVQTTQDLPCNSIVGWRRQHLAIHEIGTQVVRIVLDSLPSE
jgi:hypothetical protein